MGSNPTLSVFSWILPQGAPVTLRFAQESDREHLHRWLLEPSSQLGFPMASDREVEDSVQQWIPLCLGGYGIVAERDGTPVGLANINQQPCVRLQHQALISIIVTEAERGQGIGSLLLENLIALGRHLHLDTLYLEVHEGNPARRLYARMGFRELGALPAFICEEDGTLRAKHIMELPLSDATGAVSSDVLEKSAETSEQ